MFNNKQWRIVFLGLFSIFLADAAASSSSSHGYDRYMSEEDEQRHALNQSIIRGDIRDRRLQALLTEYTPSHMPTEVIAREHITEIQERHPEWASHFSLQFGNLQNPDAYSFADYTSRMLFWGPSGCGKTFTALALAKLCNMHTLFISGESVQTSFRMSGSVFLNDLFSTLKAHPDRKFMIIFDELAHLAKLSKDEEDTTQHSTVRRFWQCLDDISTRRHICVVGTDNLDPKEYEKQIQTRFHAHIFKFRGISAPALAKSIYFEFTNKDETNFCGQHDLIKSASSLDEDLNDNLEVQSLAKILPKYKCSFMVETLQQYIQSVSYLSEREIRILINKAIEAASLEAFDAQSSSSVSDYEILVEERHLLEAFKPHMRTLMQRFFAHHIPKAIFSARTLSYFFMTGGIGLRACNEKYTKYALGLIYMGLIINAFNTGNKERAQDAQGFSALINLSESYANHRHYVDSMHRQNEVQEREDV